MYIMALNNRLHYVHSVLFKQELPCGVTGSQPGGCTPLFVFIRLWRLCVHYEIFRPYDPAAR